MIVLDIVIIRKTTSMISMIMVSSKKNDKDIINAHLHGAAPRRRAVAAVQQHVHPVPRHRLHHLLAKPHPKRGQPQRHIPLCAQHPPSCSGMQHAVHHH